MDRQSSQLPVIPRCGTTGRPHCPPPHHGQIRRRGPTRDALDVVDDTHRRSSKEEGSWRADGRPAEMLTMWGRKGV